MANEKVDIAKELNRYRREYDLIQKIPYSYKENKEFQKMKNDGEPLPDGVVEYTVTGEPIGEFYHLYQANLTEAELTEYLTYKKLKMLRTIKNCIVFFTVMTVISLTLAIIGAFAGVSVLAWFY